MVHPSMTEHLSGWEDVSGCLWNLIVHESERDRKQREEGRNREGVGMESVTKTEINKVSER